MPTGNASCSLNSLNFLTQTAALQRMPFISSSSKAGSSDSLPEDGSPSGWGDTIELEPDHLYAVLMYRGDPASWNWTFFLPNSSVSPIGSSGTLFHVIISASGRESNKTDWKFAAETKDVVSSPLVVAIIRLGDVGFLGAYETVVGQDNLLLLQMFKTVAIPAIGSENPPAVFSSRVWFLDAICTLHDHGVITCDDVSLLERELNRFAFTAMDKYLQNKGMHDHLFSIARAFCNCTPTGWTAYISEKCS
ncbi:hypothetical protein H0H87_007550 [Tephrocybe sp. NHM501043]|nr:hypothetical protein H0H87_007550 [Tephrocybe sp. NHM501043]